MSVIKKWLPVLIVFIAIAGMIFVSGCSDSKSDGASSEASGKSVAEETVAAVKETVAESKVKGTIYETDKFSILQPDGWKATHEIEGNVVFEKGDFFIGLSASVLSAEQKGYFTEAQIKEDIGVFEKQNNGTPVEEVTIGGAKFFQSRGTLEGKDTTYAFGLKNGLFAVLVIWGKDHPSNVEIKAILDSIKFK